MISRVITFRQLLRLAPALALSACAVVPPQIEGGGLAECRTHFMSLDADTAADGIRDAGAWRIPGFPYLRSNRFLSSFTGGLDSARFDAWVEHLRQYGLQSRETELRNLGSDDVSSELRQLDRCGAAWAQKDLADPLRRLELRQRAPVPDDYSMLQRAVGLYPLTVPFVKLGVARYQSKVRADFALPLAALESPGELVRWQAAPAATASPSEIALWLSRPEPDALGIPALSDEQWWRMAATYAPTFWLENGGTYDQPGRIGLANGTAALDAAEPVTYFHRSYTRFGGQVLPQLAYVMWFSERPKQGWLDFYSGKLDGLVWRVTLDHDGTPLFYDTIHPCGCFHQVFPAKPLQKRPADDFWQEDVQMPQVAPTGPVAIRVHSADHYVRRIVPVAEATGESRQYQLRDYRELLSLADGERRRSLFCADGIVCGTERGERFWLWITGVNSPGAMRQQGRHATAFVGRRHFDDADLFERLFVAP